MFVPKLPVPLSPALNLPGSENPEPPKGLDFTTRNRLPDFSEKCEHCSWDTGFHRWAHSMYTMPHPLGFRFQYFLGAEPEA